MSISKPISKVESTTSNRRVSMAEEVVNGSPAEGVKASGVAGPVNDGGARDNATPSSTQAATPLVVGEPDEEQLKAAREQYAADQKARAENPNVAYIREANPNVGGESF